MIAMSTEPTDPFQGIDVGRHSAPAIADMNGDGLPDVAIANYDGIPGASFVGHVLYYENVGDPTLPAFIQRIGNANPFAKCNLPLGYYADVSIADTNGDGLPDAYFIGRDHKLQYFENVGNSTNPVLETHNDPFNGTYAGLTRAPAFADTNGDGLLDAYGVGIASFTVGGSDTRIIYYLNTGNLSNPTFAIQNKERNPFDTVIMGREPDLAFGDFTGDGLLDVVAGVKSGDLLFFRNTGSATNPIFTEQLGNANPLNGISRIVSLNLRSRPAIYDMNNDGFLDVIVGDYNGEIQYFKNTHTTSYPVFTEQFKNANPFHFWTNYRTPTVALGDTNGDGFVDAYIGISASNNDNNILYYENVGKSITDPKFEQRFGEHNPMNFQTMGLPNRFITRYLDLSIVDTTGDGLLDAYVSGYNTRDILFLLNTGNKTQANYTLQPALNIEAVPYGYKGIALHDCNGDGLVDLLVTRLESTIHSQKIYFYKNIGTTSTPIFSKQTNDNNPFFSVYASTPTATSQAPPQWKLAFVDLNKVSRFMYTYRMIIARIVHSTNFFSLSNISSLPTRMVLTISSLELWMDQFITLKIMETTPTTNLSK